PRRLGGPQPGQLQREAARVAQGPQRQHQLVQRRDREAHLTEIVADELVLDHEALRYIGGVADAADATADGCLSSSAIPSNGRSPAPSPPSPCPAACSSPSAPSTSPVVSDSHRPRSASGSPSPAESAS